MLSHRFTASRCGTSRRPSPPRRVVRRPSSSGTTASGSAIQQRVQARLVAHPDLAVVDSYHSAQLGPPLDLPLQRLRVVVVEGPRCL